MEPDPFLVVEQDLVQNQLSQLGASLTQWRLANKGEKQNLGEKLSAMIQELQLDLSDLEETVQIASNDPQKFDLDERELQRRKVFIQNAQQQVFDARDEVQDRPMPTPQSARAERRGLLGETSSSTRDVEMTPAPYSNRTNQMIQMEMEKQQAAELEQDRELSALSGIMDRLGKMGRAINEELKQQGSMIDELTADVDMTQGRMNAAMSVVKKMLKSNDRGKYCAILILTVVLVILVVLVFD